MTRRPSVPPRADAPWPWWVWAGAAVIVMACAAYGLLGCDRTGVVIASALEGAAVTMDATERAEGNVAIDQAVQAGKPLAEAEAALDHVRAKWQPAWIALSVALSSAVAWSEGRGSLETLLAGYCALATKAPVLALPTAVLCTEVSK